MKEAYLKAISYYLPGQVLTNEELVSEFPGWTVEKVAQKLGINSRHIAGENETAGDMAEQAALNLFREWDIKPETIDFILLCTQSPDYFLPTTACLLQNHLGIPEKSGAIDFNLGCSGFVYGLALAKGLIASNTANNILLLTSETYTKHIHKNDIGNRTIFGDAACATLISSEGMALIGEFSLGTDGKGANNLIVKTGGMRHRKSLEDYCMNEGVCKSSDHLYMNGSEIFSFTLDNVPEVVNETLLRNQLAKEEIDLFVFHQANKYLLNFLMKKMKIDEEKFFICIENYGNTVSSTIPIALYDAIKNNYIQSGKNVLISGFGVGYSWAGNILRFI